MARQWTSAACARSRWHYRFVVVFLLGVGACSEVPDGLPSVASPGTSSGEKPTLPSANLVTGVISGSQFDVWICGDQSGVNLGYTFESVGGLGATSGVGHEVALAERRSRAFRWMAVEQNQLRIQFIDDDSSLEWQQLAYDERVRLNLISSERGPLRCLRQSVVKKSVPKQPPVVSASAAESAELNSSKRLVRQLPGELPGNQASDLSAIGALKKLSFWLCQSETGLLAQAYFAPASDDVQGLMIEALGINAWRRGRWMALTGDSVRLDLAVQGEMILSDVSFDGPAQFMASSDRDGLLSCELESLTFSTPVGPS